MEFKEYYLGELCEIKSSKRIYAKDYVNKGIPFYRSKEIIEKSKGLDISQNLYIDNKKFEEIEEKHGIPETGDLLLTSVGTLGVPYIVKNEKFYFKDGNLTWFTNFKSLLNQYYLFYWFKSKEGIGEINRVTIGSTQKALTIKNLRYLKITLPDKKNQFKIINLIQKIENKLENNKQVIANLEELSLTLFKHWFVDFEFPDENGNPYKSSGGEMVDSEFGEIPKEWNFEKLKLLIENVKDNIRTKSLSQESRYVPLDLIPKRKLTFYNYKSSNEAKSSLIKFKKNDILLGSMRVYFHRVSLAPFDGITRNTVFTLRPRDERYLYYLLNAINKDDFIQYAANNSKGSTMPYAVWDGILDEVTVLNPPLQYLIEFNSIVQKYFDISIVLLKQNRQLEDLRDTLLPKLMSGEIEIPDDIEVNEDELSI